MGERWVRPPLVASEPPPAWRATWRYRAAAVLVAALLVLLGVLAYRALSGATAQDPGVGALPAPAGASPLSLLGPVPLSPLGPVPLSPTGPAAAA